MELSPEKLLYAITSCNTLADYESYASYNYRKNGLHHMANGCKEREKMYREAAQHLTELRAILVTQKLKEGLTQPFPCGIINQE